MSFLLTCPNCGPREVADFSFGGEARSRPGTRSRPDGELSLRELCSYNYFRRNVAGVQREWWFHSFGCRTWLLAERDTATNEVLSTKPVGQAGTERAGREGAERASRTASEPGR